jgi:copper(I)-binding protein
MRTPEKMKPLIATLATAALVLGACGGDDGASTAAESVTTTGAWARTSPMASDIGAMYVVIETAADDALLAVMVPPEVAARTELHETAMIEPEDMSGHMGDDEMDGGHMGEGGLDDDGAGVMRMRQVQRIELPAGQSVQLEPGGFHVMLLDLGAPLRAGDTFEAKLVFADADPVEVTVEVRDEAP